MPTRVAVWEIDGDEARELEPIALASENRLRDLIALRSQLIDENLLIIGREVQTPWGKRIDLLGLDQDGNAVVVELKRNRTPRDVVAQVLEYGAWVADLSTRDIHEIASEYGELKVPLAEAFQTRFETALPEDLNTSHRLVVAAAELDDQTERILQYLQDKHRVPINAVFFAHYDVEGRSLLARSWLSAPEDVIERTEERSGAPWTGYLVVNIKEGRHRLWEDCRKYGFVAAGQGPRWSGFIRKLRPRDRIFAYVPGSGYVGYGEVVTEPMMARDFKVNGKPLLDQKLAQPGMAENADDPERAEWVAGVHWKATVPVADAKQDRAWRKNQNVVFKLRDQVTLDGVQRAFGLSDSSQP